MIELIQSLVNVVGLGAICAGVWKVSRLTALVEDVRDNHLAHIRATLVRQGQRIDRLYERKP